MNVAGEIVVPAATASNDPGPEQHDMAPTDDVTFALADEVVLSSDPNGVAAESIRVLRTHVITQHLRLGRRALAVCSPTAGIGCTSVAVNLAVAMAQAGVKTLLIDGDLRDPQVHRFIVPSRVVPGLRQCLSDPAVSLNDAVQPDVLPNLSLIYAGGAATHPQELIAGGRFKEIADACLRDFEMTIVDTPPGNSSADARQLCSVVTYAMIVVGRNRTFTADVKTLAEELHSDRARIIGAVLREG